MAPPDKESGPAAQRARPNEVAASTTTSTPRIGGRAPLAPVELYPPAGRRALTAFSYRCPHCAGVHLGRAVDPAAIGGVRRGGCGRLVRLTTAEPGR